MHSFDEIRIEEVSAHDTELLNHIGKFRLEVWKVETRVDESLLAKGVWIEDVDYHSRHWIAKDQEGIVGSARLSIHSILLENPDGYLFEKAGLEVPLPTAHFCKLVVHRRARGKGIAGRLNKIRIEAAKHMGAKSVLVTASEKNSRLLSKIGFIDSGIRETFSNRPGYEFKAMKLDIL